jgi:predicted regulator of Ras-like GTPase activity (Roadblock/LC7/MglB family)
MKKTLDELCAMQGVNGAFILSEEGALLEFSAPPIYDRETLSQAAALLARATESMSVQHSDWDTLVAHYEDSKLFVIKAEDFSLCVIADEMLNLPFLNVAVKVAKKKIAKKMGEAAQPMSTAASFSGYTSSQLTDGYNAQAPLPSIPAPRATSVPTPQAAYASGGQFAPEHQSGMSSSSGETSGMFWSGMGGSGMQSTAVSVADEASSEMLTRVSDALAGVVGPMAKVFVKEVVRKICPSEPFNMTSVRQLISELEQRHISDKDDLREFRDGIYK